MENDIEKGDVDIFRDTPVRYLGMYLFYMLILLPVDAACTLLLAELFYVHDSRQSVEGRGGGGNYSRVVLNPTRTQTHSYPNI